jgi:hypothetical protein
MKQLTVFYRIPVFAGGIPANFKQVIEGYRQPVVTPAAIIPIQGKAKG